MRYEIVFICVKKYDIGNILSHELIFAYDVINYILMGEVWQLLNLYVWGY